MENDPLLLRQQQLIMRSAQLRASIANQSQVLIKPLAFVDKVREGVQWLSRHPAWPVGAVLVLIMLKPRKAIVWAGRLWWGWQTYKRLQGRIGKEP